MKRLILLPFLLMLGTVAPLNAQVITSVGCDSMALVVNVGSQETALSLYHPGGYLTWPSSENVMEWLFTDEEGNVVHEVTLMDENFVSFGHNVPLTDTLFVSVLLTNDSSMYNGSPVACLIEDYLTWEETEIVPGSFVGSWTLGDAVGTYAGEPSNIGDPALGFPSIARKLVSIVDITGREVNPEPNQLLFFIYDDGYVEKRYFVQNR